MVFRLVCHLLQHLIEVGLTHRKCSVTRLPIESRKIGLLRFDPLGRPLTLDRLNFQVVLIRFGRIWTVPPDNAIVTATRRVWIIQPRAIALGIGPIKAFRPEGACYAMLQSLSNILVHLIYSTKTVNVQLLMLFGKSFIGIQRPFSNRAIVPPFSSIP